MRKLAIKKIHVNQHNIRANLKNGNTELPVYSIKFKGKTYICDKFNVVGVLTSRYEPERPLSCGARVWLETTSPVTLFKNTITGEEIMGILQ